MDATLLQPTWGASWKAFIKENADRWNIAYLQKTTLPYEDNVLDILMENLERLWRGESALRNQVV